MEVFYRSYLASAQQLQVTSGYQTDRADVGNGNHGRERSESRLKEDKEMHHRIRNWPMLSLKFLTAKVKKETSGYAVLTI